jgi:hypothetical protein
LDESPLIGTFNVQKEGIKTKVVCRLNPPEDYSSELAQRARENGECKITPPGSDKPLSFLGDYFRLSRKNGS